MHKTIYEFLAAHVERGTADTPDAVDLVFLKVKPKGNPDAAQLRALIDAHDGNYIEGIDLFDGKEHSYLEIGGWIGDQGYALCLMALGKALGLWELLTPMMMLGLKSDDPMTLQMAGMGYLSIKAAKA